jgi:DNA excision repair protein ERCC-2
MKVDILFRHGHLRKHQSELAQDSLDAIEKGNILLAEAPTGLGKTDALLGAALTVAEKEGLTVFFLTPKISQHRIGLEVIRGINKKHNKRFSVVDVIGKRHLCIHPALKNADAESFYAACNAMKKSEMCDFCRKATGYTRAETEIASSLFSSLKPSLENASHSELFRTCSEIGACPFEMMMKMAKEANVVIADYYHLFIPAVRDTFLTKTKKDPAKSIIIIDEAHNLPKRLRDYASATVTTGLLKRADKELGELGFEPLGLSDVLLDWSSKRIGNEKEIGTDAGEFISALGESFDVNQLMETLMLKGEEFALKTGGRSALLKTASFMEKLALAQGDGHVDILGRKEKGQFSLSRRSLDPGPLSRYINKFRAGILASATLSPLNMYADLLGIDKTRTITKTYPSPFSKDNRMLIITEGMTTKYNRRVFEEFVKYASKIEKIYERSPGSVVVFFPSFKVLNEVAPLIKGIPCLVQKEGSKPSDVAEMAHEFKKGKRLMLVVQGGSFSEGVDFSNNEIKVAIVAGIALEEVGVETDAVIGYYDKKFGKGWEYGYIYPAVTKALQSAGRAIRKETDKAVLVFMDERFAWQNYRRLLPDERFIITGNPEKYVEVFFR